MKKFTLTIAVVLFAFSASAQVGLDYFLPANVQYNPNIPTPKSVLGAEVGEWHVRHDQLVQYMYAIAEASDRVTITEHSRSYENRPLLVLTITSPANHRNLEQIRTKHLGLLDASSSDNLDISAMPIVVSMNYSVHGNEPSGSNASLVAAYYLAAAQGPEIDEMLKNSVILLDPSLNPDGLARFAHWANMHKSKNTLVTDSRSREFNENWPGGRTNHYWFDLNRDWLPVQHPESRGRINVFQNWMPNILTDHHEMGTNATFFFQPGIPSRTHPLTPERNQALTGAIADYHAEYLDEIQVLYYSKESFDDFYYGKGSTYPDINGSVGILFEQASSRGHAQESIHGILEFPATIKNQFVTSLSTLKAAQSLREEMLAHMREFYQEAANEARNSSTKAYVFGEEFDQARTSHLADIMNMHKIEVYELARDISSGGKEFKAGKAYVVPTNQKQAKLIQAIFDVRTEFADSLFYDVSAFNLAQAFNLPYAQLNAREYNNNLHGNAFDGNIKLTGSVIGGRSNYAYIFEWDEYYAPKALYKLLDEGVRAKVASLPFKSMISNGAKDFDYGSILIPMGVQDDQQKVHRLIQEVAAENGITVYAVATGLTPEGMDLGSSNFQNLQLPKVAIFTSSSSEVGEVWHLLDQRYHMPLTIIDFSDANGTDFSRYNVLVMPAGGYGSLNDNTVEEIKRWVRNGGTIVSYKQGIYWAKQNGLANFDFVERPRNGDDEVERRPYIKAGDDGGAGVIGGAIFNAKIDLTHPLGYGFNDENFTIFRNSTIFVKPGNNPYSTPIMYTDKPLANGYTSDANIELLKNSAGAVVSSFGRGRVIAMTDNPNFRAFWFGTNKIFMNAVFFGNTISGRTTN